MDTLPQDAAPAPWRRAYPADVAWDMRFQPETLPEMLSEALRRFGPRPALDFMGAKWTYAELGDAVARCAEGFRRLGVKPGDRVGLCLPNCPWFVIAYHGALRAGAVVVAFSPLDVEEEMAAKARDAGVEVLVSLDLDPILPRALGLLRDASVPVSRVVVARFAQALPAAKAIAFRVLRRASIAAVPRGDDRVLELGHLLASPPLAHPVPRAPEDVACLQYTGGTTGSPKGAMLTHANLCANLRQVNAWNPGLRDGEERTLAIIPFFHIFAMTVAMNGALAKGGEIVMLPRFDWPMARAALRRTRPTVLPGVPTLFRALMDKGATADDLRSVRACISGGAPLPQKLREDFERLAGCTLVEGYGLTEASPVCLCNPFSGENRSGTIGLPVPGVRAEIRSLEDPSRPVPPGERGELCVAGPNVMKGYWNRPEETAASFTADGLLRTGDVGVMDADGYVTLVDRIKDLILCSGFNVYPRNIEEAIHRHPAVAAATVVGMPDDYRGETPAAFVELKPGASATPEELAEFLRDKLSPIELPERIELRAQLPRTGVGKLSKKELKAELLQQRPTA